ncbi:hypothetical protein MUCCIDRAFT_107299 [Mucor lusitanicus CBS 277.49]|uniref:Uncharacterized protein n=1 Tax=Mucor lusitanicus CBS 277.49 TaxID=747725 RepID=A0A168NTF8_MUCCL|nr:hypothetical protein MUCCIDRAFT_116326 [Mucor lusitanicus CBS 277.49]OAD06715.1 hypothetical protein MUCCIDRAFT_107299 [Mucor lusitanicus CBS 277.49]
MELMLQEACSITNNSRVDGTDINFLKLGLSNSINLMGSAYRETRHEFIFSECGVTNFATLNKARDSEAMYCGIVRSLVEILLKGTGLKAINGELTSANTKRMSIIN